MESVQQPMPTQYDMQPPPVYMEQPQASPFNLQVLLNLIANMNWQVVKEPRGFMKVLQFLFTICAFATTTSFSSSFSFFVECGNNVDSSTVKGVVEYNFRLDHTVIREEICGSMQNVLVRGDVSSDAEFYVAVGVLSWLYVLAALVLYTIFSPMYSSNPLLPFVDCGMHLLLAVLWLASASAWANSLSTLKWATSFETLMQENPLICGKAAFTCMPNYEPTYQKLNISIILGFLNLFLFASNIWFLYKETSFFQAMKQQQQLQVQQQQQQFGQPPQTQDFPQQQLPQQY